MYNNTNRYFACAKLKMTVGKLKKARFLLLLLNGYITMEFNVCLSFSLLFEYAHKYYVRYNSISTVN